MNFNKLITFLFLLMSVITPSHAEFMYLARSPEALMMGDAYTAVADDSYTLFYNPAVMGRHNGVTFHVLNPSFKLTNPVDVNIGFDGVDVTTNLDRFQNFPSDPALITDKILGYPLYLSLGATPTIKMQNFAISLLGVSKMKFSLENAIHPMLNLDYRTDTGFIMGYGFPITGRKGKGKSAVGNTTSVGVAVKRIKRAGIDETYDLFGTRLLEILNNASDAQAIRRQLGYSKGSAWGFDLGLDSTTTFGNSTLAFGTSLLDVGGTKFKKEEGDVDVPEQEMSLNFGSAFSQNWGLLSYTFSFDYHNAIDPSMAIMSKTHLGFKLDLPIIDLYLGWNGGYSSLGLATDIMFMRLMVGMYGIETSPNFREKEDRRAVVSLELLNIHVDL
ncbi:MAG: hypothetical protein Fur0010_27360 [Bdellovibrio sp.]